MGRGRVGALDLHKALGADGLVATSGMVDIIRIVLDRRRILAAQRMTSEELTRTKKHIGHSAAPRYTAASGCRGISLEAVLGRLWCVREDIECIEEPSARVMAESASPFSGCWGSFMAAVI